jgi:predicted nucleic acid-binding protein
MRTFFDTSVLVTALIRYNNKHAATQQWLNRALSGEFPWAVSQHTLAELYATLTVLPISPRISPAVARQMIRDSVEKSATVVSLSAEEYSQTLTEMADRGLPGVIIYDALLTKAARKVRAQRVLTLNGRHFARVWPEGASLIVSP